MSIYKKELLSFYSEGDTFSITDFIARMRQKYSSGCPAESAIRNGIHRLTATGWLTPDWHHRGMYTLLPNKDPNIQHVHLHHDNDVLKFLESSLNISITNKMHFLLLYVENKYMHKWVFISDAVDGDTLLKTNLGSNILVRKPLIKFTSHNWFSVCFIELFYLFTEESPLFLQNISSYDPTTYRYCLGDFLDSFSDFAFKTGSVRRPNAARVSKKDIEQYLLYLFDFPSKQRYLHEYKVEMDHLDAKHLPLIHGLLSTHIKQLQATNSQNRLDTLAWTDFARFGETYYRYKSLDKILCSRLSFIGITESLMESSSHVQSSGPEIIKLRSQNHFFIFRR